jgi:hypothetical protein
MRVLAYSPNDWQVDSPLRNGVCLSKSGEGGASAHARRTTNASEREDG